MADIATPNLPSRDFESTSRFYAKLGFTEEWRDEGWMMLRCDALRLEFFPHPALDAAASWFSCCLRLDDVDVFYAACRAAAIPESTQGYPRLHPPHVSGWGGKVAALVDLDGTLLRLIQN